MNTIDPIEALLAVIGVKPIISHVVEPITDEQWSQVRDFNHEVNKQAYRLCNSKLDPVADFDPVAYFPTLQALTEPYKPQQVAAMLAALPKWLPAGFHVGFGAYAQRTFNFLHDHCPRQVQAAVTGGRQLRPPKALLFQFEELLYVLDKPLQAFNLMSDGSLTVKQVGALTSVYPTLMAYMQKTLEAELPATRVTKGISYHLPNATQRAISRFCGIRSDKGAVGLQQAPQPTTSPSKPPAQVQTATQRLSNQMMTSAQQASVPAAR